jgi:hypothetical protein
MAVTQLSDATPPSDNDIVSVVASLVAKEQKSANPDDPPSHLVLLLAALEIDRRLAERGAGR